MQTKLCYTVALLVDSHRCSLKKKHKLFHAQDSTPRAILPELCPHETLTVRDLA
jgi:hypothetical protein